MQDAWWFLSKPRNELHFVKNNTSIILSTETLHKNKLYTEIINSKDGNQLLYIENSHPISHILMYKYKSLTLPIRNWYVAAQNTSSNYNFWVWLMY